MAHGLADAAAQAVVAVGGIDRTAPLACAGELDQPIGSIVTECQAVAVGGLLFNHVARAVEAVAGAVQVVEAVVGQRLLAVQAVTGSIEGVAVGLVAVLAAGQAAGGIITVGNNAGGLVTLHASETHAAQGVVLILLPAAVLRATQRKVIELAEVRVAALQNQGLYLVTRCQRQAAQGFTVQGIRLQVDFQVQPRGAQPVQVAAAVGVPVERG
ncbi:hypothetical protein [Vreelandella sp. GE22]